MNILNAKIGTKLEIELIDSLEKKTSPTFVSQITDIKDKERILISAPIHESRVANIPMGASIRCIFLHEKYGLFSFIGTVSKKEHVNNIAEFEITITSNLEKIQRRDYFRLDCVVDAQYRIIPEQADNKDAQDCPPVYNKALTKNMSGCGACIAVDEEIAADAKLEVIIALDAASSVKAVCEVVRSTPMQIDRGRKNELALRFSQISQRDQNTIIKYVFDQQKYLVKKNAGR